MSYVLTLVSSETSKPVTSAHIKGIGKIIDVYNFSYTAAPVWLAPDKAVDLGIPDKPQRAMILHLQEFLAESKIDIFFNAIEKRRKKLLLADMDSTVVSSETLDELAEFAGIKERVAEITKRAMEGELDFHAALRERVGLLKGLDADKLHDTLEATIVNPGAQALVRVMKAGGANCVLVSGGFTFFTEAIARKVGFDTHHGNKLGIENKVLTGKVLEPILDKHSKLDFLKYYCNEMRILPTQAMSIGDGANDLPMLKAAGLGIGYHAKQTVKDVIDNLIDYGDLTAALYAQGYTKQQIG